MIKKNKGFMLIEVIGASALSLLLVFSMTLIGEQDTKKTLRTQKIAEAGAYLHTLSYAAAKFVHTPANVSGWTVGQIHTLTVSQLISAGFLNASFGSREFAGKSPFGEDYTITAEMTPLSNNNINVFVAGNANYNWVALKRIGIDSTDNVSLAKLREEISRQTLKQYGLSSNKDARIRVNIANIADSLILKESANTLMNEVINISNLQAAKIKADSLLIRSNKLKVL